LYIPDEEEKSFENSKANKKLKKIMSNHLNSADKTSSKKSRNSTLKYLKK
jgi:hypothetical protein